MSGISNEKLATRTPEGKFGSLAYRPGVCAAVAVRFAGQPSDADTVTIGSKTFEFDNNSSVTAGNVSVTIGGSAELSMEALAAAINNEYDHSSYDYRALDINDATAILVVKATPDNDTTATSDASANITVGAATLTGGEAPNEGYKPFAVARRTVVAIEDTEGFAMFAFDFVPVHAIAILQDASATPANTQSVDLLVEIVSSGLGGYSVVKVSDGASLQMAAGDIITVLAFA